MTVEHERDGIKRWCVTCNDYHGVAARCPRSEDKPMTKCKNPESCPWCSTTCRFGDEPDEDNPMSDQFNNLTPAEHERLALLMEECGEVVQVIGKILRHGYKSTHPNGGPNNRGLLEEECGHVRHAMIRLCNAGDLSKANIHDCADEKEMNVQKYLHHN